MKEEKEEILNKSIKVSEDVWEALNFLKIEKKAKSINEVIADMLEKTKKGGEEGVKRF